MARSISLSHPRAYLWRGYEVFPLKREKNWKVLSDLSEHFEGKTEGFPSIFFNLVPPEEEEGKTPYKSGGGDFQVRGGKTEGGCLVKTREGGDVRARRVRRVEPAWTCRLQGSHWEEAPWSLCLSKKERGPKRENG